MGQPARKFADAPARPRLSVVDPRTRQHRTASGRRTAPGEAECRALFSAVCVVFVVLTAFGLARVALTAELTRAAFSGGDLRQEIKNQRQMTERLEADRSALLTPSRIEGIAAESMRMTQPKSVRYIRLSNKKARAVAGETRSPVVAAADASPPTGDARPDGLSKFVATAMDLAADEARALLVGDVGLASSR